MLANLFRKASPLPSFPSGNVRPVTPNEIEEREMWQVKIPDIVFEVVNELIAKTIVEGQSTFFIQDCNDLLIQRRFGSDGSDKWSWNDVVVAYRRAGWYVECRYLGYHDTRHQFFFIKPK